MKRAYDKDFDTFLGQTFGDEGAPDIIEINKIFEQKASKKDKSKDFRSFLKSKKQQAEKEMKEDGVDDIVVASKPK